MDLLVHAGLFLVERPDFIRTLREMIVNNHIYGVPGTHALALHLRRLGADDLVGTYVKSFTDVWTLSKPATW